MLRTNSANDKLTIFFLFFSHKIGSDISYKLSPKDTIYMIYQILFSSSSSSLKKNYNDDDLVFHISFNII